MGWGGGQGATWRGSGNAAAVQISQWSLFDCSPFKNPPRSQSRPYSTSRTTRSRKNLRNGAEKNNPKVRWRRCGRNDLRRSRTAVPSPRRLGSARTIFCFFFFFPEVTVSKRCCCCCCCPLVWLVWYGAGDPVPPQTDSCRDKNASLSNRSNRT